MKRSIPLWATAAIALAWPLASLAQPGEGARGGGQEQQRQHGQAGADDRQEKGARQGGPVGRAPAAAAHAPDNARPQPAQQVPQQAARGSASAPPNVQARQVQRPADQAQGQRPTGQVQAQRGPQSPAPAPPNVQARQTQRPADQAQGLGPSGQFQAQRGPGGGGQPAAGYGGPRPGGQAPSAAIASLRRNVPASRRFNAGAYRSPRGYAPRHWGYGERLPRDYYARDYWITDFLMYALFAPPPGLMWVRVGPDALLIDQYTGEIIQVDYGVFY